MPEKEKPIGNAEWNALEERMREALLCGAPDVTQGRVKAGRYATPSQALELAGDVAAFVNFCRDSQKSARALRMFAMHYATLALLERDENPALQSESWRACATPILDVVRRNNPSWCEIMRLQLEALPLEHGEIFETGPRARAPERLEESERALLLLPTTEFDAALATLVRCAGYVHATCASKKEHRDCLMHATTLAQVVADLAAGDVAHVWSLSAHVRHALKARRPGATRAKRAYAALCRHLAQRVLHGALELSKLCIATAPVPVCAE